MAYNFDKIGLQQWIKVRWNGELIRTTVGRAIFNEAFPAKWGEKFRQPHDGQVGAQEARHRVLPSPR